MVTLCSVAARGASSNTFIRSSTLSSSSFADKSIVFCLRNNKQRHHSWLTKNSRCSISSSFSISYCDLKLPITTTTTTTTKINHNYFVSQKGTRPFNTTTTTTTKCTSDQVANTRQITFLTDVEGDRDYLTRYVQISKILYFRSVTPNYDQTIDEKLGYSNYFPYDHCIDFVSSSSSSSSPNNNNDNNNDNDNVDNMLVYGGDVWDQGGSDLYVIRQLLHLKRRFPNHVHFIMGNRDINKMRFIQELGSLDMEYAPNCNGLYWLRGTGRLGDPENGPMKPMTAIERLKWMLSSTMGSPKAFQYRKWELQQEILQKSKEQDSTIKIATDWDVVQSYRHSCSPQGEMGQYLSHANLFLQFGDIAFVHGGIPEKPTMNATVTQQKNNDNKHNNIINNNSNYYWDDMTFAMPWLPEYVTAKEVGVDTIQDWIIALNQFAKDNVTAWSKYYHDNNNNINNSHEIWATIGGYHQSKETQPFGPLMQYGMGSTSDKKRNPTVVYNGWCTEGMPRRFFPNTKINTNTKESNGYVNNIKEFMKRSGIKLLCSGHQPQGEMPNPIRLDIDTSNDDNNNTESINDNTKTSTSFLLSCDTSYSGNVKWYETTNQETNKNNNNDDSSSKSARGLQAVCEVLIQQDCTTKSIKNVSCHGRFSDGTEYDAQPLSLFANDNNNNSNFIPNAATQDANNTTLFFVVGTLSKQSLPTTNNNQQSDANNFPTSSTTPWWTRAYFPSTNSYLLSTAQGFDCWHTIVKAD